jgi:hypothetical protein
LPRIGPEDIWIYIYERGEARYTDLINKFEKTGQCAKQTLINYKLRLESEGKIARKISESTKRPVYYVPEAWKHEVRNVIDRREIHQNIDKLTPEELVELKKELKEQFK